MTVDSVVNLPSLCRLTTTTVPSPVNVIVKDHKASTVRLWVASVGVEQTSPDVAAIVARLATTVSLAVSVSQ